VVATSVIDNCCRIDGTNIKEENHKWVGSYKVLLISWLQKGLRLILNLFISFKLVKLKENEKIYYA
jgi:hypothetical protein